ncbi:MAG: sugar-binding domain-containing protein [bacterium]
MYHEVLLSGKWELRHEPLGCDLAATAAALSAAADAWIAAPVPGDIHQALVAAGAINEPLLGLNSFACRWTEDRSWWYRKTFTRPAGWKDADRVELELNGLDANAAIFLNGLPLGSHRTSFRPFVMDVKPRLQPGHNVLLVRLTTGADTVCDADIDAPDGVRAGTEAGNGRPERGDPRRTMVRKPQYSFGWDWSPRLATTAIGGDVKLRLLKAACIREVRLLPLRQGRDEVLLRAAVTVDQLHFWQTVEGKVKLAITAPNGRRHTVAWAGLLRSGDNHIDFAIRLKNPALWWPNGYGAQPLHRVEAAVRVGSETAVFPAFDYGIRFVELDTARGTFAVRINGRKVFCKGGNWIPADALYARTPRATYDTLVREAREANFTLLRVWGGGLYEHDAFYDACDRHGILVWQDFMYACAPYPDHLEWFRVEAEREADFQTRRLRHHACLAVWSGNNENSWGFKEWWQERTRGGAWLYNYMLPDVVRRNSPEIPYWNGSPYGGSVSPNDAKVGDRHHWHDCMMNPDMLRRITPEEYDKCQSLFVSEYGYIGAPVRKTVETYLDGANFDRKGAVWQHHNNTFEKDTVDAGIRKHYRDHENLTPDEYCLYSGLCQGLMYSYSLESFRARAACHGGLFWMYNDSWGEVGWTIIDYYLRRKPSFYFVRRALAPIRLILRAAGDEIRITAANDTLRDVGIRFDCGYMSFDGKTTDLKRGRATVRAAARTELGRFRRGQHDAATGLWVVRPVGQPRVLPAIFRAMDYRQLHVPPAQFAVHVTSGDTVELHARTYAHAVHLELPAGAVPADDYFDLLPGETRRIDIQCSRPLSPGKVRAQAVNQ